MGAEAAVLAGNSELLESRTNALCELLAGFCGGGEAASAPSTLRRAYRGACDGVSAI